MNRTKNLNECIKSTKTIKQIKNHVVIDWSSVTEVSIDDPFINLFRVNGEKQWWLTRAYNVGFNFAKNDYILKIDADTLISKDLINSSEYLNYDLIVFKENNNDYGNFIIKKSLIEEINGFNEFIWGWGWDDHDFIKRAKEVENIKFKEIENSIIKIENKLTDKRIPKSRRFLNNEETYSYALIKSYNNANSYISSKNLWSKNNKIGYSQNNSSISIDHYYSPALLLFLVKSKRRFLIISTFFNIYFSKNRIGKYLFTLFSLISPNKMNEKLFGIFLYPFK
jgi:hypothetical protein